ncbi:MAG: hypothetical protein LBC89_06900 [Bacteroidales bacterium]|jgi:hypothetical protein|nr:hypothetical protein [Bacteroidales bacterium]
MKKLLLLILILTAICLLNAQNVGKIMHSNIKNISMYVDGLQKDWGIEPSLKPDIYKHFDAAKSTCRIKFISDIDSLEFIAEADKPIDFVIIYKGDTAQTRIKFTNKYENTLTNDEKLYALSLFWSEAKYNFAFIDKLKFDLDSLYQNLIPKVLQTSNDYEFYDLMKKFAGSFKDGHTQCVYSNSHLYTDYAPMEVRYFGDSLYIVSVSEDLAKIFPLGSKIITVNALPFNVYMQQFIEPYIDSDFKPTVKMLSAPRLLGYKSLKDTLLLTCKTPDNRILSNYVPINGSSFTGKYLGYEAKYPQSQIEISWLKNDIAVLAFNTFYDRREDYLINLFDKMKDTLYFAKGIIIDLRKNGGGTTPVAWHLLKHIIKEPYFLNYAWQTRINDGVKKANGNWREEYKDFYKNQAYRTVLGDTIFIPDSIKRFDVPVVILISSSTVSAAEDFLIDLYEHPNRPLLIGQPSFGSTGSPLMVWGFPENGWARICTRRVLFPYSLKPFTEGIQPDIQVDYTFDEFMSGKDKDIEVAVKELEKQMKRR